MKDFIKRRFILLVLIILLGMMSFLLIKQWAVNKGLTKKYNEAEKKISSYIDILQEKETKNSELLSTNITLNEWLVEKEETNKQLEEEIATVSKEASILSNRLVTLETGLDYKDQIIMKLNGEVSRCTLTQNEAVIDQRLPVVLIDMVKTHLLALSEGNEILFTSTLFGNKMSEALSAYFDLNKNKPFTPSKISCYQDMLPDRVVLVTVTFHEGSGHNIAVIFTERGWKVIGYD